ncbi:MAG TPA: hypothetical protein VNF29_08825 [Candidatus Binataceae bacterium]|nr:hypothetical protein [Candidatus Binataceae bacterium]
MPLQRHNRFPRPLERVAAAILALGLAVASVPLVITAHRAGAAIPCLRAGIRHPLQSPDRATDVAPMARAAGSEIVVRTIALVVFTLLLLSGPRIAYAHGVVGDYMFLEPLVAEDPTPANELDIVQPAWNRAADGRTFSIGSSIEKILGADGEGLPRFSVGGGSAWIYRSPNQGRDAQGFDDLNLFAKYAFLIVPEHDFLMSFALQMQIPAGNPGVEAQQHTSLGPELLWEKALGDLPNLPYLKYLRPLGFQGDVGYLPALGGHTSHQLFADQAVEYSLQYLSNNVQDIGLIAPLRNLFLFTEFNYSQLVKGPPGETFPNLVATPGIAYVGYRFELSVGTQLALNNASVPGTHAAVLGLLDIFYDSIIPQGNWKLFGN